MIGESNRSKSLKEECIEAQSHPLYGWFAALYAKSFPIYEQRTEAQLRAAFESKEYHLLAFTEGGRAVGFVCFWAFDTYLYIEHLAVSRDLRGRGYGSQILKQVVRGASGKRVLLEIDPVTDEVSAARLRFYEQSGFYAAPYAHRHPPYRAGYEAHELLVLSHGTPLSEDEYALFAHDLLVTVMARGEAKAKQTDTKH